MKNYFEFNWNQNNGAILLPPQYPNKVMYFTSEPQLLTKQESET